MHNDLGRRRVLAKWRRGWRWRRAWNWTEAMPLNARLSQVGVDRDVEGFKRPEVFPWRDFGRGPQRLAERSIKFWVPATPNSDSVTAITSDQPPADHPHQHWQPDFRSQTQSTVSDSHHTYHGKDPTLQPPPIPQYEYSPAMIRNAASGYSRCSKAPTVFGPLA